MTVLREESLHSVDPSGLENVVSLAEEALRAGGVIAYPTETVYGLGCDYMSAEGYRAILGLKRLKEAKPFILLIPDEGWMNRLSGDREAIGRLKPVIDAFWPGPLTVMIGASPGLPPHLVGPEGMISMRLSPDPFVKALLARYRRPITSTSANPTGGSPARTLSEIRDHFSSSSEQIHLAVFCGERSGPPSTLLRFSGGRFEVLREGAILASRIEETFQA